MATLGEQPGNTEEPLRVDQDVSEDAEADEPRDWSRWMALAIAFVVGVAATVVVMNARQQAAERSEVNLVVADAEPSAGSPSELQFSIMNAGSNDVDVVDLEVVGWAIDSLGQDSPSRRDAAVHVPASAWARVNLLVEVDCDERPDTAVSVTVRTDAGEELVEVPLAERDHLEMTTFWTEACPTRPIASVNLRFGESTQLNADKLVMQFELLQFDERRLRVMDIESATGGFTAAARNLPLELPRGEATRMTVEWEVTDCDRVADVAGVFVSVSVVGRQFGPTRTRLTADNRTLAELARLTALACET